MSTRPEGRTTISLNNPHGWLAFRGALQTISMTPDPMAGLLTILFPSMCAEEAKQIP